MTMTLPTTAVPQRSVQQRHDALKHANEIRIARAHFKRDLKRGRVSLHELLRDPPSSPHPLAGASIEDLLLALPHYGPTKVANVLAGQGISPRKKLAGLTERQRFALELSLPESTGR